MIENNPNYAVVQLFFFFQVNLNFLFVFFCFFFIGNPDSPGKPTVSNITDHTVYLSWTESSSEKHSPATGYIVEKCDLTTGVWRHVTSTTACHADVDCLEEYKQYQFRIRAENLFGSSLPSEHSDTIITRKATEKVDYDELCKLSVIIMWRFLL